MGQTPQDRCDFRKYSRTFIQYIHTNILKALTAFIPKEIDYIIYNGIEELPHFNPDVDRVNPPSVVIEFRKVLAESQALIICTPECAGSLEKCVGMAGFIR